MQALFAEHHYEEPIYKNGRYLHYEGEDTELTKDQNCLFSWLYPTSLVTEEILEIFTCTMFKKLMTACYMAPDDYYKYHNQLQDWFVSKPQKPPEKSLTPLIWLIGHSTVLIQIGNINILTDPVFGNLSVLYHRNHPPAIPFDKLPRINIILISHCHFDHYDKKSIDQIIQRDDPFVILPENTIPSISSLSPIDIAVKYYTPHFNLNKTKQLSWWQSRKIKTEKSDQTIQITFLPTRHWTGLVFGDANRSLWGSYMIECNNYCIYFGGDSAFDKDLFAAIAEKYPSIDAALLPVGPNEPRDLLKNSHMSAEEAVMAFNILTKNCQNNQPIFIPIHWGPFKLANDRFLEPIERLFSAWKPANTICTHVTHNNAGDKWLLLPRFGEQIALA